MTARIRFDLETAKLLLPAKELELIRAAYSRRPTPELRARMALMMVWADDYAGIIALLDDAPDATFDEHLLLAQAWLAQESKEGNARARAVADRALTLGQPPNLRAGALAYRGKAEVREGDRAAARASFLAALALDPHNKNACKRLIALDLDDGNADEVVAMADRLIASGAAHARLFAGAVLGRARRGDIAGARAAAGESEFRRAQVLTPPPGWDSIAAFNAALAEELLAHPEIRMERYGSASEQTWRIDMPLTRSSPLMRQLLESISAAVLEYADDIAASDHPWARSSPSDALMRSWCVITEQAGHETWHVHQFGWLSGSYYVQVPEGIAQGESEAGCIAFGLPETLAGDAASAAYGIDQVRPQDGLLLMFPSHTYHRTYPHGFDDRRICVAFDLRPA